jgi:hypothetical protein
VRSRPVVGEIEAGCFDTTGMRAARWRSSARARGRRAPSRGRSGDHRTDERPLR